ISDIIDGFVNNPQLAVDSRCLAGVTPLTFVTTGNIVNFSVVNFATDLVARKPSVFLPALVTVLATLALLTTLVVLPIAWLVGLRKPPEEPDTSALMSGTDPAALAGQAKAAQGMMAGGAKGALGAIKPTDVDAGALLPGLAPWLAILAGLLPVAFGVA